MRTGILYLATTVIFFAIDMLWLGVFAKSFYREKLGFLLSEKVNWFAAALFYLLYIAGILFFAVMPALRENSLTQALISGALLGGLCYATYDLTNQATIEKWPVAVTVVDIVWGMLLTGSVAALSFLFGVRYLE